MASKFDDDYGAFPQPSPVSPKSAYSNQQTSSQKTRHASDASSSNATSSRESAADSSSPTKGNRIPASRSASLLGLRWLRSWPMVALLLLGILGTVGTTAVISLFRIPTVPNCRAVFWPTASASLRLQCADSYAAQGDVRSLLSAIKLVDHLPEDHPLRFDINRRIESWANQVLDLAEQSFENGDLEEAIASARQIPAKTAAAKVVEERISRWETIWKEGEDAFNTAVAKLQEKDFQKAFSLSVKLLDVDNQYWASEKYNELTKMISLAREDSRKLSEALGFAKEGTVKGYTEALKRLKDIDEESVFYTEAQEKRKELAKEMLEVGEALLADQALSDAQAMLNAIPRDTGLDREIEDFQVFVTAYQQAWAGNVSGLENAINRMKTLGQDRPRYAKGQQLIAKWESELRNLSLLTQAKERAGRGSIPDLTAAISIARQIPDGSPQWADASEQINQWRTRVETVEDRPILEQAERIASGGTPDSLRAAIQEARKIGSNRTLSGEANERIALWTGRIQRIEDQPVLNQARQRAATGDLAGAIAIAERIGSGRALYSEAQEAIDSWQAQETGRLRLGEALSVAANGDGDSLARAIEIAQQVPAQSNNRTRANSQINQWSWQLLRQAETASTRSLEQAIALANRIPSQAEAYDAAQVRIGNWQTTLQNIEDANRPLILTAPENTSSGNGETGN